MSLVDKLKKYLDSKTAEELATEWNEMFGDEPEIPKGWVSIEDHLPVMLAMDIGKGYSEYKVKDEHGKESIAWVSDHNVWYHMAKEVGITHWWNK